MSLGSRLELRIAQRLILTPQLQQAIKLLQLPHLELSNLLNQELIENPFLEEAIDEVPIEELIPEEKESIEFEVAYEDTEVPLEGLMNFTVDEYFEERGSDGRDLGYFNPGTVSPPSFEQFLSKEPDLYDHLLWQLRLSNEPEDIRRVGEIIIGNIDENGYLSASIEDIIKGAQTERETSEKALSLIQSFDPPGVGARNVAECLLIQLKALDLRDTIVEKIIINNMDELEKKKYVRIAQQYNLPIKDVMAAVKIIEGLEPKPGRNFSTASVNHVIPDVYLIRIADGYQIILNDEGLPRLRISNFYKKLIQQNNIFPKEDKQFFIEKLRSAVGLLKGLDQRSRTIYRVTESLLKLQGDFFDKGVQYLNPLTLRDVASMLNMHESTISRVTSNKYLSCEHGIFCFRFLFSSALQSGMGSVSSTSVKNSIKKIVIEEDSRKPLSDQHIVEMLKGSGIIIARRTVAKYRERLGIPSQTHRRKSIN
ncbi:MAG: RNA polymerase sigma-54 factor [Thermodesulfovibrio sp. RBG_19FT_COMBO_42_12]|nr:MAG: RNA polymerase sigma-54 factor [Thermodesulfovibrio sp. RBG_19FT_COMBO_42_12]